MARSFKERLLERLPGTRTVSDEVRTRTRQEGWVARATAFLREFRTEMKKVSWPGRKETASATAVVIATVLVIVLFLGLVDYGLGRLVYTILNF